VHTASLAATCQRVGRRLLLAALNRPAEHSRHRVVVRTCTHQHRVALASIFTITRSQFNVSERDPTRLLSKQNR